jgi:hypothetical protein
MITQRLLKTITLTKDDKDGNETICSRMCDHLKCNKMSSVSPYGGEFICTLLNKQLEVDDIFNVLRDQYCISISQRITTEVGPLR